MASPALTCPSLSCPVPACNTLSYPILPYFALSCSTPPPFFPASFHFVLSHVLSCPALPSLHLPYRVLFCPYLSLYCPSLFCPARGIPIKPCPALPCLVLCRPTMPYQHCPNTSSHSQPSPSPLSITLPRLALLNLTLSYPGLPLPLLTPGTLQEGRDANLTLGPATRTLLGPAAHTHGTRASTVYCVVSRARMAMYKHLYVCI